jgi:hypothetical protein
MLANMVVYMKGAFKVDTKEGLQRENLNPLGAFIFDPSGKPIS